MNEEIRNENFEEVVDGEIIGEESVDENANGTDAAGRKKRFFGKVLGVVKPVAVKVGKVALFGATAGYAASFALRAYCRSKGLDIVTIPAGSAETMRGIFKGIAEELHDLELKETAQEAIEAVTDVVTDVVTNETVE